MLPWYHLNSHARGQLKNPITEGIRDSLQRTIPFSRPAPKGNAALSTGPPLTAYGDGSLQPDHDNEAAFFLAFQLNTQYTTFLSVLQVFSQSFLFSPNDPVTYSDALAQRI